MNEIGRRQILTGGPVLLVAATAATRLAAAAPTQAPAAPTIAPAAAHAFFDDVVRAPQAGGDR